MRDPRTLVAALLLAFALRAGAADQWLNPWGAGDQQWGTDQQPVDAVSKPRDFFLPDAGYLGRNPSDKPEDLEIPGPHPGGERRFLRYVNGALVDAWLARPAPIEVEDFRLHGSEEWSGVVLGPGENGFRAFGDAVSWQVGQRTAMHWKDRSSSLEILACRSAPTGRYAVEHEAPLALGAAGRHNAKITGDLKDIVKGVSDAISGCLDLAPKPVEGHLIVAYDAKGRPAQIKANTDQPSSDVLRCWAGAVAGTTAPPGQAFSAKIFRMR